MAVLYFVLAIGEIIVTAWPFAFDAPLWRYSFASMAATLSATTLLGGLLLLLLAVLTSDRGAFVAATVVNFVAAIFYWSFIPMVMLDAIQLKGDVSQSDGGKFKFTAAWILTKLALSGLAFLLMGVAAIRAKRALRGPVVTGGATPRVIGTT